MRSLRARGSGNRQDQEFLLEDLELVRFRADRESCDGNSAGEVVSEMGSLLVIILGAVLAINMALVALQIG
ncbi:MAG: hypothetical protein ACREHV_16570 [Rhizomicrobium sp.]